MKPSPEDALDPGKLSKETFFDWFCRITQKDLRHDDREKLRAYFAARGPEWYAFLWEKWREFHQEHAGFALPKLPGDRGRPAEPGRDTPRRPFIWNELGTAGPHQGQGGIDPRLAFFGPLFYPGIVFTDAVAVPSEICKSLSAEELKTHHSRDRFLEFVDMLIDYAPLFKTGQLAVMSERTAFGGVRPPYPHKNPWENNDIEQDIRTRSMDGTLSKKDRTAAAAIPWIYGNLSFAEAHDLDPIFLEESMRSVELASDYIAEAAFAGEPRDVCSQLIPPPKFQFSFKAGDEPKSTREAAELMVQLMDDEHWGRVREIMREAAKQSSRGDYTQYIQEGMLDLMSASRKAPPAFAQITGQLVENYAGTAVTWMSLAVGSYYGLDWLQEYVDSNVGANFIYSAGTATAALYAAEKLIKRTQRRRHVGPDVLTYGSKMIGDPSQEELKRRVDIERQIERWRQNMRKS